jgi:hypothetical protein
MDWTLRNKHLPPTTKPYWTYNDDSFTTLPKLIEDLENVPVKHRGLNYTVDYNSLSKDYYKYLEHEKITPYPAVLNYGGLSQVDITYLQNKTYDFPDIKSETIRTQAILNNFVNRVENAGYSLERNIYSGY